jgi:hypothetical protein
MAIGEQIPETKLAKVGESASPPGIGEGDVDLVYLDGMADCVDTLFVAALWGFLGHLATRARVIMFDRGGQGASDAPSRVRHFRAGSDWPMTLGTGVQTAQRQGEPTSDHPSRGPCSSRRSPPISQSTGRDPKG